MFTFPCPRSASTRPSLRAFTLCLILLLAVFLVVASVENGKAQSTDRLVLVWAASDAPRGYHNTSSLAWGEWDNDVELDLASVAHVYENDAGTLKLDPANGFGWDGGNSGESVAWGDWDNDGDLDLAVGARVYENDAGTLKLDPANGF